MAESDEHESKTEEPTEKRIQDAIEKGQLPVSRELVVAAGFFGFLLCIGFVLDAESAFLIRSLGLMLENAGGIRLTSGADAWKYLFYSLSQLGRFVASPLAILVICGLAAAFAQAAPRLVIDRIVPDLSRISPQRGWRRLFGATGIFELIKAMLKILIIGLATFFSLNFEKSKMSDAMRIDPVALPSLAQTLMMHFASTVCVAAGILAAVDFASARYRWRRDIRMTRQELREEVKQSEGDAFVKARMRSLAQSRARKRMMASVPRATLIISNPTHYSIALRYKRDEGGAPLVIAKGKDILALKIREIACAHDIPVLERRDLVRAMYDHVEVDKMIPQEFFRPVAELIHFLNARSARR